MYKVLALDLDGTVLTDNQGIHPEVRQAIIDAQQYCNVVIVTGRHHTAAKPYYRELNLDTPIICCNGTYVYDYQSDQVLDETAIDHDNAIRFIELAKQFQMKLVMYVTHAMTYSKYNPIAYMQALEQWAQQYPSYLQPQIHQVESFEETVKENQYIWKFVVEGLPSSIERLASLRWVQEHFNGERSWSNRIDFSAKGNSKGNRLKTYVNALGYHANHVIAIGDNHNDISMIEYAGLGVAMRNSDDYVKSHARVVCNTDNNGVGLAQLIREHIKG